MMLQNVEKVLQKEKFDNGVHLIFVDRSRQIAGDRWLVKIECALYLDAETARRWLAENRSGMENEVEEEENEGKILLRKLIRERNFIADTERLQAVDEILKQLRTTIFPYLRKSSAVARLLLEAFPAGSHGEGAVAVENPFSHLDDDEGPADFSSLFG